MATRLIAKTTPLNTNELKNFSLLPSILTELCGKRLEKYAHTIFVFKQIKEESDRTSAAAAALKGEISYSIEKYNLCSRDQ